MDKASRSTFPENLSKPAQRALQQAGYSDLEQLSSVSDSELLQLHGFGPEGLMIIKEALEQAGLRTAAQPQGAPSAPASSGAKTGASARQVPERSEGQVPGVSADDDHGGSKGRRKG